MNDDRKPAHGLTARDSFVPGWQDRLQLLDSVTSTQEEAKSWPRQVPPREQPSVPRSRPAAGDVWAGSGIRQRARESG